MQISRGNELEVILPRGFQLKEAENFILKKSGWIKKHLRSKKAEPDYLFFGDEIKVKEYYQLFLKNHKIIFKDGVLEIRSPEESNTKISDLYSAWLKHSAKKYLIYRAGQLAAEYKFNLKRISIRGQKTRWGSCSSAGNLSFNYRLMRYRKEVIDYVIIHELCHLKEMNHSKNFWSLVQSFCPDYKKLRKELKGRT
ncbi:MAG: SprT family zinc-dependent metalloprotease [Ignavibacteriaceae bacterium]